MLEEQVNGDGEVMPCCCYMAHTYISVAATWLINCRIPVQLYVRSVGEEIEDIEDASAMDSWDKISYINRPVENQGFAVSLSDASSVFDSIKSLSQSDGRWRYDSSSAESSTYVAVAETTLEALAGVVSLVDPEVDQSRESRGTYFTPFEKSNKVKRRFCFEEESKSGSQFTVRIAVLKTHSGVALTSLHSSTPTRFQKPPPPPAYLSGSSKVSDKTGTATYECLSTVRILLHSRIQRQQISPIPFRHVPSNVIIAVTSAAAVFLFPAIIYYAVLRHRQPPPSASLLRPRTPPPPPPPPPTTQSGTSKPSPRRRLHRLPRILRSPRRR
ncbi:uncharacterized protein A4U43_C03F3280 [Asparagus officinalis]|uniref:Uncharacterized protein n=1 Tax=Asparagus officinalis TaxID=4686 RepID=A0A5P1FC67_ASPOF|nr:uncharacterized protein A4U43_C03F3280 [Asparagus officinalis]